MNIYADQTIDQKAFGCCNLYFRRVKPENKYKSIDSIGSGKPFFEVLFLFRILLHRLLHSQ